MENKNLLRVAIITTHPIQYYAPIFRLLSLRGCVQPKVFYTWEQAAKPTYDPGFGTTVAWDIPLLEGYEYTFVRNTASRPGSNHFRGIKNPSLIQEVTDWHPDRILVFGWSYQSHIEVLRYFKGKIPVYFRGDSHLLNERKGIKQLFRKTLLKWVYRHIDYAFYVGSNNKAYFLRHGLNESQLIWAPHVIDNQRFQKNLLNNRQEAKQWRLSLGIPTESMVFLYVGKFEHVKNPSIIVDAFSRISSSHKHVHLILVGNGRLEPELKQKALNQAGRIHFIPFQNQSRMPVVYGLGDVYVLPSLSETWGLAVNEAMACGLPILVSDKAGCAVDLVQVEKNGYIFVSGNEESLSDKLNEIIANRQKLAAMSQVSMEIISHWSIEAVCQTMEQSFLST